MEPTIKFNFDILISDIGVTDCIAGNENGQKILNFFLESRLGGLDKNLREEIIQTLKSICGSKVGDTFSFIPAGSSGSGGWSPEMTHLLILLPISQQA